MVDTIKQRVARMVIYDKFSQSQLSVINCDEYEDDSFRITINESILYQNIAKDDALHFIHLACNAYECLAFLVMDEDFYEMAVGYDKLDSMTILGPELATVPALFISGDVKPAQIKEMINDLNKEYPFVVEQSDRFKPRKRQLS